MKTRLARTIGALAVLLFPIWANAQFALIPMITSATPVPGGAGNFKAITNQDGSDPLAPSLDGTSMAFVAIDASNRSGVYRWNNGIITKVANTSTQMPNGGPTFDLLRFASISGPKVLFRGQGSGIDGLFVSDGTQITGVTTIGSSGIGAASIAGNDVAYAGDNKVFVNRNGSPVQLGSYQYVGNAHIGRGGYVVYEANTSNSLRGIYLADPNNVVSTVADTNTPVPGGTGNFTGFNVLFPSDDGPDVAFGGFGASTGGVYTRINGILKALAVNGQAAPNGQTFFFSPAFEPEISLDNQHVAFLGVSGTNVNTAKGAIFTDYRGGKLERVIGNGDSISGKLVERLEISPDALSGSNLVFTVRFTDASSMIYMARLPEPASLLSILPLLLVSRRRRRC